MANIYGRPSRPVHEHLYGVPQRNVGYVERPIILASIVAGLRICSPTVGRQIIALSGFAGTGKTQLMLRYCYNYCDEYDLVIWLKPGSYGSGWRNNLSTYLNLEHNHLTQDVIADRLCELKWLLVMEDANEQILRDIKEVFPAANGNIILATRRRIPLITTIHVDGMQVNEAITLFLGGTPKDMRTFFCAQEIVKEFECVPLAICLARDNIKLSNMSLQAYLATLRYELPYNVVLGTMASIIQAGLAQVSAESHLAIQILLVWTFFRAEGVPHQFFVNQQSALRLHIPQGKNTVQAIQEALFVLRRYYILRPVFDTTTGRQSDAMHHLLQRIFHSSLKFKQKQNWATNISTALFNEIIILYNNPDSLLSEWLIDTYYMHVYRLLSILDTWHDPFHNVHLMEVLKVMVRYINTHGSRVGSQFLLEYYRKHNQT